MILDWTGFTQWLTNITTNPVFISLISIFTTLGAVLIVISKTSIGRKAINKMNELSRAASEQIEYIHNKIIETKENVDKFKKEILEKEESFKKELLQKTSIVYNQLDMFENYIIDCLSEFPNVKIQAKLNAFKSKWEKEKEKIKLVMGESYSEINKKYKELQEQIDALKEGISDGKHDNRTEEETL